jgi:hypothetical protein
VNLGWCHSYLSKADLLFIFQGLSLFSRILGRVQFLGLNSKPVLARQVLSHLNCGPSPSRFRYRVSYLRMDCQDYSLPIYASCIAEARTDFFIEMGSREHFLAEAGLKP